MTATELLTAIRSEIERRHAYEKKQYEKKKPDGRPNDGWAESLAIMGVLEELLSYLDTLKADEPNIGLIQYAWYMEGYRDCKFKREPKWILVTDEKGPRHEPNPRYGEPIDEPKDVDEAAKAYEDGLGYYECINQWPSVAFKAGAEWMRERMEEEWLKDRDVCFWDGVAEGRAQKEKEDNR